MAMFMKKEHSDGLQEAITKFTQDFSTQMLIAFKSKVIEDAVSRIEGEDEEVEYQLMEPSVPDWNLKVGMLTKRGDARKNWNKRYFVAKNEADGFIIEYYTDDKKKTLKGRISCAGYKVHKDDKLKKNGLTLVPDDDARRTWYIACDNAEERDDWYSLFDFACDNALPAVDPDPMIQSSFEVAYANLKRSMGFYGSTKHDRPPAEMLAKLLLDDLKRGILTDILNEVSDPTGMLKATARSMVSSMVGSMCATACSTAWGAAKTSIDGTKKIIVEKVNETINPIIEVQVAVKEKIVETVSSVTDPAMSNMAAVALAPVVDIAMAEIVAAFKAGMRGFHSKTEAHLSELADADESTRTNAMRRLLNNVAYSYYSESPMVEAYQILRDLEDTKLGDVLSQCPNISIWRFIWRLDSGLRKMIRKAIFTCTKLIEEMGDPAAALKDTMDRFVADSKVVVEGLVFTGLKEMLSGLVDENLLSPTLSLIEPLAAEVPEPMQELVNLEDLLSSTIEDIVDSGVQAATSSAIKGVLADLDRWEN